MNLFTNSVIQDFENNDFDFNLDSFSIQTIFSYLVSCSNFETCFNFSSACKLFNFATIQTLIQYHLPIKNREDTKLIEVNYLPYFQLKKADLAEGRIDHWKMKNHIDGMLEQCSTRGFYQSIPILIKNGANIFSTNYYSEFPSFLAAKNGFVKTVEQFLLNGMDINHKSESQESLLLKAKNLKMVKFLIENNAEINIKNERGETRLYYASENNNLDMVTYLVENNAEVNIKNEGGDTPLLRALELNNLKVAKFLLENTSDTNIQNISGDTALLYASKNNNLELVKFLIENNAEVNVKTHQGTTPLLNAVKNNNLDMVTYLIEKNSEINTQDDCGDTPLLYASRLNNLDMIKYLIEKNANINTQYQNGYTALMFICDQEQENLETVQYFFTLQNLDLTLKNTKNETAEDLVQKERHKNIRRLFQIKKNQK